jgi:hypothetical protein
VETFRKNKEKLRRMGWFHMVDPDDLDDLQEFAEYLEALFHKPCSIFEEDGELVLLENRALVEHVRGLKIEVYPREHAPPHFHVRSAKVNASFSIANCERLEGYIPSFEELKVRYWYKSAKPKLIDAWNATRPSDCPVGPYVEITEKERK